MSIEEPSHAGSGRISCPLSSVAPTHAASRVAHSASQVPAVGASFPSAADNTAEKQASPAPRPSRELSTCAFCAAHADNSAVKQSNAINRWHVEFGRIFM